MKKFKLNFLFLFIPVLLISQNEYKKPKYAIFFTGSFTNNLKLHLKINNKISSTKRRISFQLCIRKNGPDSVVKLVDSSIFHCVFGETCPISPDFFRNVWNRLPRGEYKISFNDIYCSDGKSDGNTIYIPSIYYGNVKKE